MSDFNLQKPILGNLPLPIITPRLILRPPVPGDGPIITEAIFENLAMFKPYLGWASNPPTVEDFETYARKGAANWILRDNSEPYLPLLIFNKKTNEFVGATGYLHLQWEIARVETAYWLRPAFKGQGYMAEAINAVVQYAFNVFKVKQVNISCDDNNKTSHLIAEKLGFKRDAVIKIHHNNINTKSNDKIIYSRTSLIDLPKLDIQY